MNGHDLRRPREGGDPAGAVGVSDLDSRLRGNDAQYPTGVIVGTAKITECRRAPHNGHYEWHLSDVRRMKKPRKPKRQPQPVWFRPF